MNGWIEVQKKKTITKSEKGKKEIKGNRSKQQYDRDTISGWMKI